MTQKRVEDVCRDLLVAPLARIDQKMKNLRRNFFVDAAILVGSLASTMVTHGHTLVTAAAIVAASQAMTHYRQEKTEPDQIRQHPSFFYWEVTRGLGSDLRSVGWGVGQALSSVVGSD